MGGSWSAKETAMGASAAAELSISPPSFLTDGGCESKIDPAEIITTSLPDLLSGSLIQQECAPVSGLIMKPLPAGWTVPYVGDLGGSGPGVAYRQCLSCQGFREDKSVREQQGDGDRREETYSFHRLAPCLFDEPAQGTATGTKSLRRRPAKTNPFWSINRGVCDKCNSGATSKAAVIANDCKRAQVPRISELQVSLESLGQIEARVLVDQIIREFYKKPPLFCQIHPAGSVSFRLAQL
jgi:hypothetical protein